jgi:hypothetical protein
MRLPIDAHNDPVAPMSDLLPRPDRPAACRERLTGQIQRLNRKHLY